MARELRIVVSADTAQADRALAGTETKVQGVTKATGELDTKLANATGSISAASLAAIGLTSAFVVEKIVGFANKVLEFADRMQDLSQQTHIGVEALQRFDFVAIGAGTTVEVLAEAFGRMSARLAGGDSGAVRGMEMLGLNVDKFLKLSAEERIFAVADAASKLGDQTQRDQALYELFGRRFMELTPLMTSQLRELANHAPIISEDELEAIARFHDQMEQGGRTLMIWTANALDAAKAAFLMNEQVTDLERLDKSTKKFIETQVQQLDIYNKLVPPLKDYTIKGLELKLVEDGLTASVKESIKAHDEHEKAIKKSADAAKKAEDNHRQLQAIIGLGYMKAAQDAIAATERMRVEMNHIETQITADYLGQLQQRNEAAIEAADARAKAERDEANAYGLLLMERDRQTMDTTKNMSQYFSEMFANVGQGVESLMWMLGDALGPRMRHVIQGFTEAWHNGRQVWSGILRGMSGDFSGWMDAIMGGIGLIRSAFNALKGLFGGGEEGTVVNPARDKFLSQWGNPSDKGVGGAGWNLASILTGLGAGEGGGQIFAALQSADTMALFRPAAQAIVEFLTSHGEQASMNFAVGGMVPRDGLAMVHRDEAVLTPRGVAAVGGAGAVAALNQGAGDSALARKFDDLSSTLTMLLQTLPTAFGHEMQLRRAHRTSG